MKFGLRKPSWKKSLSARASLKRALRHSLKLKAPKGGGWFTNPKKACYNRIYSRTTISIGTLFKAFFGAEPKVNHKNETEKQFSQNHSEIIRVDEKKIQMQKIAYVIQQKQQIELSKIVQILHGHIDAQKEKELMRMQEEMQIEKERQILLTKPLIEKFVKMNLDDTIKFPSLSSIINNPILTADYQLALKEIIRNECKIDVNLDFLHPLIFKEAKRQILSKFKASFLEINPNLEGSIDLQDWLNAYFDTFENDDSHNFDFQAMIIQDGIKIPVMYFSEVEKEELQTIVDAEGISIETLSLIGEMAKTEEQRKTLKLAGKLSYAMANGEKLVTREELTITSIDTMTGVEFEHFVKDLFSKCGYKAEVTRASGDQGADLIIEKFGERTVVQAKRYSSNVSNGAIQEVVAAKAYYGCSKAIVITNNYFTKSAIELAYSNNVELCDRDQLEKKLAEYNLITASTGNE